MLNRVIKRRKRQGNERVRKKIMSGEREADKRKTERRWMKETEIIDGKQQMETGGRVMQIPREKKKKAQQGRSELSRNQEN